MRNSRKPTLILDAGGSCSGKSFFADKLKEEVSKFGRTISIIRLDNCFRDIDDPCLPHIGKIPVFDAPESYHQDEIKKYVSDLINGKSIRYPRYDLDKNKRIIGSTDLIEPADVVIVDGLFAIRELSYLCYGYEDRIDIIKVYIEANSDTRLTRLIRRDQQYAEERTIRSVFINRLLPLHMKHVQGQKRLANLVIENDTEEMIAC